MGKAGTGGHQDGFLSTLNLSGKAVKSARREEKTRSREMLSHICASMQDLVSRGCNSRTL